MKPFVYVITLFIASSTAFGQGTGSSSTTGTGSTPGVIKEGQQGTVKILAPKAGAKITTEFVTVNFEMPPQNSADPSPTFLLRLDNREPVRTNTTEHTFTGLTPGRHTLTVELIDANDTPVAGTKSELEFTVLAPARRESQSPRSSEPSQVAVSESHGPQFLTANYQAGTDGADRKKEEAALETQEAAGPPLPGQSEPVKTVEPPEAAGSPATSDLPGTGSHLPLLSLVGFGVLAGGVIAAIKTR